MRCRYAAYCTQKFLFFWHTVWILSTEAEAPAVIWYEVTDGVHVGQKMGVCSGLVFPCGCLPVCIHRAACVDSFILRRRSKSKDQPSWSPVDCFVFRFILYISPPSFPRTCSSSVIWRRWPWELPGLLWWRVLFPFLSMINRDGGKKGSQTGPEWTGS